MEGLQEYPTRLLRSCQAEYNTCEMPFFLDELVLGTESEADIIVYVDEQETTYHKIRSGKQYGGHL